MVDKRRSTATKKPATKRKRLARAPATSSTVNFQKRVPFFRNVRSNMPLSFTTKLRYHDIVQLDSNIDTAGSTVLSCNGLFQPNITGGGHQPRNFDQLMAMYDHYLVIAARITIIPEVQNTQGILGITLRDSTAATSDINLDMEGGNTVYGPVGQSQGGGSSVSTLSQTVDPSKWLNRPLRQASLIGSAVGNPTEGVFFHIFNFSIDPAFNANVLNVDVLIEYTAMFIEPRVPGES